MEPGETSAQAPGPLNAPERLPSRSNASKGKDIAGTRPRTSLETPRNRSPRKVRRRPEPTGAERVGDNSRILENAMNPRAGSRLQHTCTPRPEQTPTAERNREEGTRTRPAATTPQLHRCAMRLPHRGRIKLRLVHSPADWPRTGPMLQHRRRASARSARSWSGSGRYRNTRAQEQSWVFVACEGAD
jgi:hypothetical protein